MSLFKIFARLSIFTVYFWFGILKFLGLSPANPLVLALFNMTIHPVFGSLSFALFIKIFAVYEMLIGILFLIPKYQKIATILIIPHLIMTVLPLFLLPKIVWQKFFVPSLEGQYIIKNVLIVAVLLGLREEQ